MVGFHCRTVVKVENAFAVLHLVAETGRVFCFTLYTTGDSNNKSCFHDVFKVLFGAHRKS